MGTHVDCQWAMPPLMSVLWVGATPQVDCQSPIIFAGLAVRVVQCNNAVLQDRTMPMMWQEASQHQCVEDHAALLPAPAPYLLSAA